MGHENHGGDLEIDQDPDFQRTTWMVQRVAWVFMGVIVGLGLLGLFGGGPISHATAGVPGSALVIRYDRFARKDASATLDFRLRPGPGREVRLRLNADYLDDVQIERIEPPPARVEATADGAAYVFALPESPGSAGVKIHLRPLGTGRLRGEARLDDGPGVEFGQFIYP